MCRKQEKKLIQNETITVQRETLQKETVQNKTNLYGKEEYRPGNLAYVAEMFKKILHNWGEWEAPSLQIDSYDLKVERQKEFDAVMENLSGEEEQELFRTLNSNLNTSYLSESQKLQRIEVFCRICMQDGVEQITDARYKKKLSDAKAEREKKAKPGFDYKELAEPTPQEEKASFSTERGELLYGADKWLLRTALEKDSKMEHSIVFSILARPARERMVIYYMLEHRGQTKMKPSFIPDAQINYKPDLAQLEKRSLDFSKLEKIYQEVVSAQDTVKLWNQVSQQYDRDQIEKERKELPEEVHLSEHRKAFHEKKSSAVKTLLEHIKTLQDLSDKYTAPKGIRKVFTNKRNLEKKMREEVAALAAALVAYSDLLKEDGVYETEREQKLTEMQNLDQLGKTGEQFQEKGSNKKKEIEEGGKFLGYGLAFDKAAAGATTAGLKTAAEMLKNTTDKEILEQAKMLGTMAKEGAKYTNILGIANGAISLVLGVVMGTAGLVKDRKLLDGLTMAERSLGIVNSGLSGGNSMACSIVKLAVSKAPGLDLGAGAAGVAVGGISAGVGVYSFAHAGIQKRRGKNAQEQFRRLNGTHLAADRWDSAEKEGNIEEYRKWDHRENLIKIQSRIADRKAVTAGCQIVSGLCAAAAGGCTIGGQAIAAAAFGLAGFAVTVSGKLITTWMHRKSCEEAIDEFLHMDERMEDLLEEHLRGSEDKALTELEKKQERKWFSSHKTKLRDSLRLELMEQYGYTSKKAFFAFLMEQYAVDVYTKIKPWVEGRNQNKSDVVEAYLEFVRSLGLKVQQKQEAVDGKKEKPGLPTWQMIYQKLMS